MSLVIPQTKSQQIAGFLEEQIRSGSLRPGDRLQTVRELAAMFQVSSFVINTAYNELEERGLIERRGRQGVFVSNVGQRSRFLVVDFPQAHSAESLVPQMMQAFEKTCLVAGIDLDWIYVDFLRSGDPGRILQELRRKNYSGAVLLSSFYLGNEAEIELLRQLEVPVILPHGRPNDVKTTGFTVLSVNGDQAWHDALIHLRQQGYRRVGAMGLETQYDGYEKLRTSSVEQHLKLAQQEGFELSEDSVAFFPYHDRQAFDRKLAQWLGDRPRFDAILCYSDFFAIRVYEYCRARGIRIPDNLAVMGYCGFNGCEQLMPTLSTIDLQMAENGRRAAEILIRDSQPFRAESSSSGGGSAGGPASGTVCKGELLIASHQLMVRQSTCRPAGIPTPARAE